jgi:Bifunctional DNA primase/polymerase, N-terminal/Primase C terminal 2 (PriCT-2)
MKNERLDAALCYVRRGWQIFPATRSKTGYSIEKRGIDVGTPWGRTSDAEIIRGYWRRLPSANIGLAMGAISGVFDIECDTCAAHPNLKQDGAVSLAALEAKHGALPRTLSFTSPSGSRHRLFKHPGGDFRVEHSTSKLGIGVDVIGDGFMSVVPPSRKGKGVYKWLNDLPVAAAPRWLLDLVRKPAPAPRTLESDDAELPSRELVELVLALLPNDSDEYDDWKDVGMAIWTSTAGDGFDLFDAWSRKWHGYNAANTRIAWGQIKSAPPERFGPRAIINKLAEIMPEWETAAMNPAYDAQIDEFNKLLDEVA